MDDKPICQRIWHDYNIDADLDSNLHMLNLLHENHKIYDATSVHAYEIVDAIKDPFSLQYDYGQRVLLHISYPDDFSDELPIIERYDKED